MEGVVWKIANFVLTRRRIVVEEEDTCNLEIINYPPKESYLVCLEYASVPLLILPSQLKGNEKGRFVHNLLLLFVMDMLMNLQKNHIQ
jgi:hypothetical protein